MKYQKAVRITHQQVQSLKEGDFIHFMKTMISLGVAMAKDGHTVENIFGPYSKDDSDEVLILVEGKPE